jgi:K+-sensing histidine kinase KdpD
MKQDIERAYVREERFKALGLAVAGFGPFLVTGVFVAFRGDDVVASNIALAFVVVVILAAAAGGRAAGAIAAVVSTMAYDFFFTHPYQSLKIERAEDIGTAVLLLAIGLLVAQLLQFAHRSHRRSERTHDELLRVHQVSELAAQGMAIDDLVRAVETELTGLLALRECHYESDPQSPDLPTLGRNGSLEYGKRRWVGPELSLPAEGAQIAVLGRGLEFGRIRLVPNVDVGVSIEERRAAVAITDQLGAALAAETTRL